MKKILFILLFISNVSFGTNYYVKNGGNNSSNGLSDATAWATLAKVQTASANGTIQPGDSILFKKGSTFFSADQFNGMQWWAWGGNTSVSGTALNPIVLSSYGTGAKPNFMFPNPASTDSISRVVMSFEGVEYIIVDGLSFNDTRTQPDYKNRAAWTTGGICFGERGSGAETNHCIARNCDFNRLGLGIISTGDYNSFTDNVMTDFGNVFANSGNGGDYGANAFTLGGKHTQILRNYISGTWAYSGDFGINGGAIEAFNTNDSNDIMYNTFVDCGGIMEFGATAGASTCVGNLIAYNKIINCGNISYCNVSGAFAIAPDNNKFWNNVYIENHASRFSGPNFGTGFTSFPSWPTLPVAEVLIYSNNGSPAATTVWNTQNNIYINQNNMDVYQSSSSKFLHTNNAYQLTGGSGLGFTLGGTEVSSTTNKLFVDTSNVDPALWDYHLPAGSMAINKGANLGLSPDFGGTPVTAPVSAGIFQFTTTGANGRLILYNTIIRN